MTDHAPACTTPARPSTTLALLGALAATLLAAVPAAATDAVGLAYAVADEAALAGEDLAPEAAEALDGTPLDGIDDPQTFDRTRCPDGTYEDPRTGECKRKKTYCDYRPQDCYGREYSWRSNGRNYRMRSC